MDDPEEPDMHESHVRLFVEEICFQCEVATEAERLLLDADRDSPNFVVFIHLSTLLTAIANLSKLLWGASNGNNRQRPPMRSTLNGNEDSVFKSRAVRNSFEHIDDRLDEAAPSLEPGIVVAHCVLGGSGWLSARSTLTLLRYDAEQHEVHFQYRGVCRPQPRHGGDRPPT